MKEERILQITNDINEDIDNWESRAELRECVRYWSRVAAEHAAEVAQIRHAATVEDLIGKLQRICDAVKSGTP